MTVRFGVSYRVRAWLAGLLVVSALAGSADTDEPGADAAAVQALAVELFGDPPRPSWAAGALRARASSRSSLRLSATVHSPQSVEIETSFLYVIATGLEQRAAQAFMHAHLPWIFGLAAELELGRLQQHRFALAGTGTYALWSSYRDRHSERPRGEYAWSDVPAGSVGLRHEAWGWQSFFDLGYTRSPVPEQDGRSNCVDGDRGSLSLGTRYRFAFASSTAHVGLHAQGHRVFPERVDKRLAARENGKRSETSGRVTAPSVLSTADVSGGSWAAGASARRRLSAGFPLHAGRCTPGPS